FIIDLMGLFFYNKIGSIISIGDLPTTNIIEPFFFVFPQICHTYIVNESKTGMISSFVFCVTCK
ncbi:MAG: hypothetical protein E7J03_08115, partial [Streptococcus mitis]|nr:hypothetical protein [Streptococcus mitis]